VSDEGFQIEVGQAVRRHIVRRSSPLADRGRSVLAYDSPNADPIPVFICQNVMRAIERQSTADKDREVGGVMLGGFYRNDEGSFVEVVDLIEAESATGTDISLTFTHQTWEHIHEQVARRGDEAQIVGWYHSHPGLGVFMSKQDEFIHSSFFADPWHVAIVHDPIYTNWGCFKWADGKLDRAGGFYVFCDKRQARQLREYMKAQVANRQASPRRASVSTERIAGTPSARQPSVWIAIAALLVIQLALAWIVLSRPKPAPPVDEYAAAVRLLSVSDLSGAEDQLRRELAIHPGNADACRDLRALVKATAGAGIVNPEYDGQNLILSTDEQLLRRSGVGGRPSGSIEAKAPGQEAKGGSMNADFAGDDQARVALRDYERASSTRSARLARARAIQSVVNARWSREAIDWLESEEIRQIAYGKIANPVEYAKRYKALSPARKNAVDRILAGTR